MRQAILTGPVCAGKTTLLPLVAARLGQPGIDLDAVAEKYYEEVGRSRAALHEVGGRLGDLGAYRWWQAGHPHAVRRVLEDYPDAVIAMGAGHTVYEDLALFAEVRALLRPHFCTHVGLFAWHKRPSRRRLPGGNGRHFHQVNLDGPARPAAPV